MDSQRALHFRKDPVFVGALLDPGVFQMIVLVSAQAYAVKTGGIFWFVECPVATIGKGKPVRARRPERDFAHYSG